MTAAEKAISKNHPGGREPGRDSAWPQLTSPRSLSTPPSFPCQSPTPTFAEGGCLEGQPEKMLAKGRERATAQRVKA